MNFQPHLDVKLENIARSYGRLRKSSIIKFLITKQNITIFILSLFMGRVSLFNGFMPFGVALFGAATRMELNRVIIAVGLVLGMISVGADVEIFVTVSAMVLFNALCLIVDKKEGNSKLRHAFLSLISVFIPGMVIVYLQGFFMYDLLSLIFYSSMVFCLVFIFKFSLKALTKPKAATFSNEELISLSITVALLISGLSSLHIAGISVMNVLCITVILVLGYKCGIGVGAAIGVTVGLITSFTASDTPVIIGVYAFCGLLAGVFKSMGKIGSSLGFLFGNAILTFYVNGSTEVLIHINEILISAIILFLLPKKFLNMLLGIYKNSTYSFATDKISYGNRVKEMTVKKLKDFSNAFKCIAKTYNEIAGTKPLSNKQDISALLDRVADKICKDCSLCRHCWDRNFYSTYQSFFQVIETLELKGWVAREDIPAYLLGHCERINYFVNEVNSIYEIFKVDTVWKNKINESREILSQQLSGLSKMITGLVAEIGSDEVFKSDFEYLLSEKLSESGIKVDEVIIFENKWGKYEVNISHRGCQGKRDCLNYIEDLVSETIGRKMKKDQTKCALKAGGMCTLKLVEEEVLNVTMGVAGKSKDGILQSGDSYTFLNTGEGKFIVALSDGMGTGKSAAIQSKTVIGLLEELVDSGFDSDTTVNMINSILLMKSDEESFATIDLSIIDLYDGDVEFIKIGAAPTFIKKNDKVKTIKTVSLPVGLVSSIETELMHYTVENGSFIVMVTDGVYDSFGEGIGDGSGLDDFLSEISSKNPQEIADIMLKKAISNKHGKPEDDMLVLVAKIWSKVR